MTLNQLRSWSPLIPATVAFFALSTPLFLDLHLHLRRFLGNEFPFSTQGTYSAPLIAHHLTDHCVTAPLVLALVLRQQEGHWALESLLLCPCLSYSPHLRATKPALSWSFSPTPSPSFAEVNPHSWHRLYPVPEQEQSKTSVFCFEALTGFHSHVNSGIIIQDWLIPNSSEQNFIKHTCI